MRKYLHTLFLLCLLSFAPSTLFARADLGVSKADSLLADSIVAAYTLQLEELAVQLENTSQENSQPSPYLFRIFGLGTLYNSALTQSMSQNSDEEETTEKAASKIVQTKSLPALGSGTDSQLLLNELINEQLNRAYVLRPDLFVTTQTDLMSTTKLRSDLAKKVDEEQKLADKVVEDVPDIQVEAVEPEVKKPNFWAFKGNGSMQFTQSYFSKNWYQGGENNYTMLSMLTLDANYNNQRKIQWDNKFEAQLGFQTSESSTPKFRPTSNLLRLTSNLGIKAIGNWNYSAQLQLQSQPYRGYKGGSEEIISDFLSPLYIRSSIGMDFNLKKKKFTGKLHLAPLSWVVTYVHVDSRVTRYGIDEGHNTKHEWGPNIEATFDYKITKNISWHSRSYWFSNFELTRIELENTFNLTINKYLSAKLFINPRYEDTKYYNYDPDNPDSARKTHWMMKQNLAIGFNYDF